MYFENAYFTYANSDADLGQEYVDMLGSISELGQDTLERYFDYKKFGLDLAYDYDEYSSHYFNQNYAKGGTTKSRYDNGGGVETTKAQNIKNEMYKAFEMFLSKKNTDNQLISKLQRLLGERRWFRYFDGDTMANNVRSVKSALGNRNRNYEMEQMQYALDDKGLQIYDYNGNEMFDNGGDVDRMYRYDTMVHFRTYDGEQGEIEFSGLTAFSKEDAEKKATQIFFQESADRFNAREVEYVSVWDRGLAYDNGGGVDTKFGGGGVVVFDNEGESYDRYTIFTADGSVYGMSDNPMSPNGFNQYLGDNTEITMGSHLGKRLKSVPKEIEQSVKNRMSE
jgi:hypothetical protein